MRRVAAPLVVAPPTGARIRTRLRPSEWDEAVVQAVGELLGRLAGQDLRLRCEIGPGPDQRAIRKQAMTAACSSRWAGAITRTSNDQWERGFKNLLDARVGLQRAARKLRARLAVPAGARQGRTRGYQSRAERFQKQRRLRHVQARLAEVQERILTGRVSVCRGGRRLAKLRHTLDRDDTALTVTAWRACGRRSGCSSPPTARPTSSGATRPSGCIPTRAGWRSGCRPRLHTCRTRRVGHPPTGCPARWPSPTVGASGRRRPPAGPSGTTSAWTRPRAAARARAAGTLTLPGGSRLVRYRRWTSSVSIAAWGRPQR